MTTSIELPPAVAAALDDPRPGARSTVDAAGIPFSALAWGQADDRPLLLMHGVTSSAEIWWRIGPALAATGRRVVAVDLPGHGHTGHWQGHHRFHDNARDLAAFVAAAGLGRDDLQVIGHSWGAMTAAALPAVGLRPATLVLVDPPAVPHAVIALMASDPTDYGHPDVETAAGALAATNPTWSPADVLAKAHALLEMDQDAARSVVLDNGDWDGGLADLLDPAADGLDIWLVRGDPATGGLLFDAWVPRFAKRIGGDHVLTIAGAPHSPMRTHPVETTADLLHTLGG